MTSIFYAAVFGFMVILPIGSIAIEALAADPADFTILLGKWFVFWGIGARLFSAGLRQAFNPAFTARDIFALTDPAGFPLVRELGFANIAMGLVGLLSIFDRDWLVPVAIAGGLFYFLAGATHVTRHERSRNETIAMASDLFLAGVLALFLLLTLIG